MRSMVLKKMDDRGQSNIDFLFGLSVFLITFIYAVTFIPGLFVSYQPGAIDLSSVAYRTAAILVEDPGWYEYTLPSGTQAGDIAWETQPNTSLERVGLADDKLSPNVLSIDKINALNDPAKVNYTLARDKMGLGGSILYDINISLVMNNTLTKQSHVDLLPGFVSKNGSTHEVGSIERSVMIDTGKEILADQGVPPTGPQLRLYVNLTGMSPRGDATIRLYNASSTVKINGLFVGSYKVPTMPLFSGYKINKNGVPITLADLQNIGYGPGDVVEITFLDSGPAGSANDIVVEADSTVFSGGDHQYMSDPMYKLGSICYPGTLKVEVWSNVLA